MAEPNAAFDTLEEGVTDDNDVADEEEDSEPDARTGEAVAFDLDDTGEGDA
jgi:hypothetical protein